MKRIICDLCGELMDSETTYPVIFVYKNPNNDALIKVSVLALSHHDLHESCLKVVVMNGIKGS